MAKLSMEEVLRACWQVGNSLALRQVLRTVLEVGNVMNAATKHANATGFKLESLLMLANTRVGPERLPSLPFSAIFELCVLKMRKARLLLFCWIPASKLAVLAGDPADKAAVDSGSSPQGQYRRNPQAGKEEALASWRGRCLRQ